MLIPCLLLSVLAPLCAQENPAKDLGSKDPVVRLGAVRAIEAGGATRDSEKLLLGALKDKDWEVVEIAAGALGEHQAKKAFAPLLKLALEGPVRGVRRAAAQSLALLDAEEAYDKLAKKAAGKESVRALEALGAMSAVLDGEVDLTRLHKALRAKEDETRRLAARAIIALAGDERPARLEVLGQDQDIALVAFALDATIEAAPSEALLPPLMEIFATEQLNDVIVRRLFAAIRQHAAADNSGGELVTGHIDMTRLAGIDKPRVRARLARLIGILGEDYDGQRALDADKALAALQQSLEDSEAAVRSAAVGSLKRIGTEAALDRAAKLSVDDPDGHVRLIAFGTVAKLRGLDDDATRALAIERLLRDADERVREAAAVRLGVKKHDDVVPPLIEALADPDWGVAVCAAISLGKTHSPAAIAPLAKLTGEGEDWRLRGAAVAGLTKVRLHEAVPPIIATLEDPEPLVWRTAWEFLSAVAHSRLDPEVAVWSEWWTENQKRVKLSLPESVLKRRKELGYVSPADRAGITQIFENLDVIVLESRGDHIEEVLSYLDLEHRLTRSGHLVEDGLHPNAVFVANCTGEITADEAERISWFVRCGGYLFGSCWALRETISRAYPGLVRKARTTGQVLDSVPAYPCTQTRTYLDGVFPPDVRPIYSLEGAHLIQVLDPERVEVLLDSPECAETWGAGNLAAWFYAGHGVILDSVNHFDLQGFETARGLKQPADRQAYAIDHLGLTYAELRENRKEAFWKKSSRASAHIKDLSVIRIVTNFVRKKRIEED